MFSYSDAVQDKYRIVQKTNLMKQLYGFACRELLPVHERTDHTILRAHSKICFAF